MPNQPEAQSSVLTERSWTVIAVRNFFFAGVWRQVNDEITVPIHTARAMIEAGNAIAKPDWPYQSTYNPLALQGVQPGSGGGGGPTTFFQNGTQIGAQSAMNFEDTASITWSIVNDTANNRIDVSAVATGGGGGGLADPTTTLGDLIVRGATGVQRFPVGTTGQVLTADNTAPLGMAWKPSTGMWQAGANNSIYYAAGVVAIGGPAPDPSITGLEIINPTGGNASINLYAFGTSGIPAFHSYRSRGTQTSKQSVQIGDWLLYLGWRGYSSLFPDGYDQGAIKVNVMDAQGRADFVIATNDGTDTVGDGYERMRITSRGNLGVGTATPTVALDVFGPWATGVEGPARIKGSASTCYLSLDTQAAAGYSAVMFLSGGVYGAEIGYNQSDHSLQFWDRAGASNPAMMIATDGRVGINVSTPSPNAILTVRDEESAGLHGITAEHIANDANGSTIYFWKSRGTEAAPLPVQANDLVMYLGWGGQVTGFGGNQGAITAHINADARTADVQFLVNDGTDNTGNGQERLRLYANGQVKVTGVYNGPAAWVAAAAPASPQVGQLWWDSTNIRLMIWNGAWIQTG